MVTMDHVALLPAYCAAGTALLALLVTMLSPGRGRPVDAAVVLLATAAGALATAGACWLAGRDGPRRSFCVSGELCSYEWTERSTVVGLLFATVTLVVLGLSTTVLLPGPGGPASAEPGRTPAGEYCFLLACAMTGGVVLGAARDLVTVVVALETLTLPLYVLVGLRRGSLVAARAAVTFFVVSVVSTAVTLLGAGLLYAGTGAVHFSALAAVLPAPALREVPLVGVAIVLVLAGLSVKVATVPFHAWVPATYDGTSLPVAAYLSTASKLGGVVAVLMVTTGPFRAWLDVTGTFFAVVAVLTMTVGNLAALRQRRMVRLLAWSSVAQAGYLVAPLGAAVAVSGRSAPSVETASTAVLAYAVLFVTLELLAFGAVVALRGDADGGWLADYAGAARARPWVAAAAVLALAGLAGLPPGLAGLFAKVTVVRALLAGGAGWLAVVVALNAVVGLAYYLRAATALYANDIHRTPSQTPRRWPRIPLGVAVAVAAVTIATLVVGFAPQVVL